MSNWDFRKKKDFKACYQLFFRYLPEKVNAGIDFKSAIGRGGYVKDILFDNLFFYNVEGKKYCTPC